MTPPPLPLAVSCGEPSGIGPELAVRARALLGAALPFVWIGDPRHLPPGTRVTEVASCEAALAVAPDRLPVLPIQFAAPATPGRPLAENAPGVVAALSLAVDLVQAGQAVALTTLPIQKEILTHGAGFGFPGHTEYLAARAGVPRVAMMLSCEALRVVPATIHIPLAEVPRHLTPALLHDTIRITRDAMIRDFGVARPRIAVTGLNPHAGEGGTMGREELDIVIPLLARLRAQGYDLRGPLPADTMFHAAARATYDVAICMYHDQALIPIKTIDFAGGVNVTLGLPFVRTSPDHGTALDIAGRGVADPSSTLAALRLAARMAAGRATTLTAA